MSNGSQLGLYPLGGFILGSVGSEVVIPIDPTNERITTGFQESSDEAIISWEDKDIEYYTGVGSRYVENIPE